MLYPEIDPVALDLGALKIRWYGLMYLVGFGAGWWLGRYRARQPAFGWKASQIDDLVFFSALGIVLGGRLGYALFYGYESLIDDPLRLLRIWEGGMSFHGGFIGVLVAMGWFARKYQKTFFEVTDFLAPLVPIGLLAGRLGNFLNGELWGAPSTVPWAMQVQCERLPALCFSKLGLDRGAALTPPLHPTQLYEAALEGLVLFLLLWWFSAKPRPRMAVSALFLIAYGCFRFMIELLRLPDAHIGYLAFDWLTMGQVLSLPMIVVGMILLAVAYRKHA